MSLFGWLKRRPRISFEEQLRVLAECGMALPPSVRPESLFVSFPREAYEKDPFRLLLCLLGSEAEDESQGPVGSLLCDRVWHFDTECIEDRGDYAAIARRLAVLARGDLPIENVEDHVDVEGGDAWVAFTLDGRRFEWKAEVRDDWVDPKMLSKFAQLLESRNTGRRFTCVDLQGQDCLIGCSTDSERKALAAATGLKVEWLR
jgi:hypothetical protein